MFSENLVEKLKERYSHLHPLIFHRSKEKAKNDVELFDILDSFPEQFPISWNEKTRRWESADDIYQVSEFSKDYFV